MMTLRDAIAQGAQHLAQADIQGARFEAQVLLSFVTGMERGHFYAYPEQALTPAQETLYLTLLERRAQHEPSAYIVGSKSFYGYDFFVDRRVLIPRPETELLVELALHHISSRIDAGSMPVVADIGTGSGAIPITIALEEPRLPLLYACDISPDALEVTSQNCERHHVTERVRLLQGDLLDPLTEPVDILLANLPYVGTDEMSEMTSDVLAYEPHLALFSGPDGLAHIARLCQQVQQRDMLKKGGIILLEIGYQQGDALTQILHDIWPHAEVSCKKDYAGWDRLVQVIM